MSDTARRNIDSMAVLQETEATEDDLAASGPASDPGTSNLEYVAPKDTWMGAIVGPCDEAFGIHPEGFSLHDATSGSTKNDEQDDFCDKITAPVFSSTQVPDLTH